MFHQPLDNPTSGSLLQTLVHLQPWRIDVRLVVVMQDLLDQQVHVIVKLKARGQSSICLSTLLSTAKCGRRYQVIYSLLALVPL